MKKNICGAIGALLVLNLFSFSAQAQWVADTNGAHTPGSISIGTNTASTPARLEVIKAPTSGYTSIFRNTTSGNDSYLYHVVSPSFHLIGSSKNGTGQLKNLGFAVGTHDGEEDIKMCINSVGEVGIGTTNTFGYKLGVNGKIITEEVVVKVYGNWPDYVFAKDYKLRPLSEVGSFVAQHGHLPEVPSATEVEKNGAALGEMNAVLLKKVEELTLYILQQEERIKKLEAAR